MTDEELKEFEEFKKWKAMQKAEHLGTAKEEDEEKEELVVSQVCMPKSSNADKMGDLGKNAENEDVEEKADATYQCGDDEEYGDFFSTTVGKCILIFVGLLICIFIYTCYVSQQQAKAQIEQNRINDSIAAENRKKQAKMQAKEAKQRAIERKEKQKHRIALLKNSVHITTARLSAPNSAAGVDAIVRFVNRSNKTIKYFRWEGYALNAVGDIVTSELSYDGNYYFGGKDTGPIKPGKSGGGCWSCIIYNWTAKKLVLSKIDIEYMDGSELNISSGEIKYIR